MYEMGSDFKVVSYFTHAGIQQSVYSSKELQCSVKDAVLVKAVLVILLTQGKFALVSTSMHGDMLNLLLSERTRFHI